MTTDEIRALAERLEAWPAMTGTTQAVEARSIFSAHVVGAMMVQAATALRDQQARLAKAEAERDEAREHSAKRAMDIVELGFMAGRTMQAEARLAKAEETGIARFKAIIELTEKKAEAEAKLAKAVEALRWLNWKGGLGLYVHARIDATLAEIEASHDGD